MCRLIEMDYCYTNGSFLDVRHFREQGHFWPIALGDVEKCVDILTMQKGFGTLKGTRDFPFAIIPHFSSLRSSPEEAVTKLSIVDF